MTLQPVCPLQIIQRQLEQVEEKQRQLEERGVAVEKALRGEAGNSLSLVPSYTFLFFLNQAGHRMLQSVSVMLLQVDVMPRFSKLKCVVTY